MRTNFRSHYDYLEKHFETFLQVLGNTTGHKGMIVAHGDKCYCYEDKWKKGGLHFYHGVAIYLLTYLRPWGHEVRETSKGWVDPGDWVLKNKDRFLPYLPSVE